MSTAPRTTRKRATGKRTRPVWLLGVSGQPARKIRLAVGESEPLQRFEARDLPSQADFDRAAPLAVFVDLDLWRSLRHAPPSWMAGARKVLVAGDSPPPSREEVLAQGFVACLKPPMAKARIVSALENARQAAQLFDEMSALLADAQRERDQMAHENSMLAFRQGLLSKAISSLEMPEVLAALSDGLARLFPVTEVLGVFWDGDPEMHMFLPAEVPDAAKATRLDYLQDLASRIGGLPSRAYSVHEFPGGNPAARTEPGLALLVPLHNGEKPFGCVSVLLERDLDRNEQELARQAVHQLAPWLRNVLDFLRFKQRADRDGLTGLFNRRSFDARLDHELKRHMRHKEGFVLMMADLDHFKQVNDTHGHLAGDAVLRNAAQALETGLRETDFVARFGGEEFAVILPHTGQAHAWMLAERLRRRVADAATRYAGRVIPVTVSIGLASFVPGQAATPASLLSQADQALYAAKNAGRDRVGMIPTREDQRAAEPRRMAG
ncbi:sensor domain-containing diguanylate cyclase [Fundidesulfovibrio soli]|uniref:GGDEF domain-containing protein n=1 Tax=Fundidesulfovibrio soli TaxID=2922716 RepID=UPI001FAEBB22|nr:GGDEF domain-containing protein [Fundidesulfovibrio soli]